MSVDLGSGTFTVDEGEITDLAWFGTYVSNEEKTMHSINPSNDSSGTYDLGDHEWTLTFAQNLAGGRRAEVVLAEYLESAL